MDAKFTHSGKQAQLSDLFKARRYLSAIRMSFCVVLRPSTKQESTRTHQKPRNNRNKFWLNQINIQLVTRIGWEIQIFFFLSFLRKFVECFLVFSHRSSKFFIRHIFYQAMKNISIFSFLIPTKALLSLIFYL